MRKAFRCQRKNSLTTMVYINRDDFLQIRSMAIADVGSQITSTSCGGHVTTQVITSPFKREREGRRKKEVVLFYWEK